MNLKNLDKAHVYMGWRIARWFDKAALRDGLHVWKAALAISVLEGYFLLAIGINISLILGFGIIPQDPKITGIPFAILITILNYLIFIRRWRVYEDEFNTYTKAQHRLYGWIIVGIVLFVLGSLIGSFYLLSQSPLAYCNTHVCP